MKRIYPDSSQASVIVQAMHAVASAEGSIALLPIEIDSLAAIQRHLLHLPAPPTPRALTIPDDLAQVVADPDMRLEVVRILLTLPFIDQKILAEKARVVERAASLLGIRENGLTILRQSVKRQYRRVTLGILKRAIQLFWSPDGKARLAHWTDMARIVLPILSPGKRTLRETYQALEHKPPGSLGHVLYHFYRANGFALPGERSGFPEKFVLHEFYHIFGGYPTTHQGEMLAVAFTGGNIDTLTSDMILISLLQFHVGATVAGLAQGISGHLNPDEFFHAIARGSEMTTNLMQNWNYWAVIDRPLVELRAEYHVPPLTGHETFSPLVVTSAASDKAAQANQVEERVAA